MHCYNGSWHLASLLPFPPPSLDMGSAFPAERLALCWPRTQHCGTAQQLPAPTGYSVRGGAAPHGTHPSNLNLSSGKELRSSGPPGRPSGPHQHPRHLTRCLRTLQSVFTYALHFAQTASSRLPTTSSIAATPRGRPRLSIYPTTQAANSKRRQPRWPFLLGLAPLPT